MPFTFGDVRRSLKKKGFAEEKDKHHIYLRLFYKGLKTHVYTKCSHGANHDDVGHGLVSAMKQQLQLDSRAQLEQLIDCPLTHENYLKLLVGKKALPE